MGKTGRKLKHESKMARKRAEKNTKKAKYEALAGTSRKSKRQTKKGGPTNFKHAHNMVNCGNPGCNLCSGHKECN